MTFNGNVGSPRLAFELMLLERMTDRIRTETLNAIGLDEAEAARISNVCSLRLPEQASSDLADYMRPLGREAAVKQLDNAESGVFAPSTAHCFTLMLWPHLYWVVNQGPDGRSWGVGFQNQARVLVPEFEPQFVRPGLWTRPTLHALADAHEVLDGWEESVLERLSFGPRRYDAAFVFGLLQQWTRAG